LLNPPWRNRSNSRLQFLSTSFYVPERPCITTRSPSQLKSGLRQTWAVQWAKDQNGKFCIVLLKLVFVKSKIQHEIMFTWNCHDQIFNTLRACNSWSIWTFDQFDMIVQCVALESWPFWAGFRAFSELYGSTSWCAQLDKCSTPNKNVRSGVDRTKL